MKEVQLEPDGWRFSFFFLPEIVMEEQKDTPGRGVILV